MDINIYAWIIIAMLFVKSGIYISKMPDKKLSKVIGASIGGLIEFLVLLKALKVI